MRKRFERGTRYHHQTIFKKVWTMHVYIKWWSKVEFFIWLMRLRLYFLFTNISQNFGMYLAVFASQVGSDSKSFNCVVKSKVIQPQLKYKTKDFLKFNSVRKRLLRLSLQPKTNWKVLPGLIINTITQLNSLFVFLLIHQ